MAVDDLREGQAGFTLIEVLCALSILALGLVGLLQAASGAGRIDNGLAERLDERLVARSLMADARFDRSLTSGTYKGRDGRYTWTIRVTPASEPWAQGHPSDDWRLYRLSTEVRGPRGGIRFDTVRLARSARP